MKGCCVWCNALVKLPKGLDPKDKVKDVVCSKECARNEAAFRIHFSDENIGLRNYEEFGINPNQRGKR